MIKKILRLIRLLLFSFMLAVCIVMGVAVVIPKRKEEAVTEVEIAKPNEKGDSTVSILGIESSE